MCARRLKLQQKALKVCLFYNPDISPLIVASHTRPPPPCFFFSKADLFLGISFMTPYFDSVNGKKIPIKTYLKTVWSEL